MNYNVAAGILLKAKNETSQAFRDLEKSSSSASKKLNADWANTSKVMTAAGISFSAVGAAGAALIVKTTQLAARVETLGVVMYQVGKNAGYTTKEMDAFEEAVRSQGITTQAARNSIIQMMQAELDLADASKLARIAQDAAVIAGTNSSATYENMIYGINTLNTEVLRTMGLTISMSKAFDDYAASAGKTAAELDGAEKKQAALQAVMQEGEKIFGTYDSAMDTAGKKVSSLARQVEEAEKSLGDVFLPVFADLVDAVTAVLKAFNGLSPAMKEFVGLSLGAGTAITSLTGPLLLLASKAPGIISSLNSMGTAFMSMPVNIAALGKTASVATNALAGTSGALASLAAGGAVAAAIIAVSAAIAKTIQFTGEWKEHIESLNEKMRETERGLIDTTGSYEEYQQGIAEINEKLNAHILTAGQLIATEEELMDMLKRGQITIQEYKNAERAATEQEYEMARAAENTGLSMSAIDWQTSEDGINAIAEAAEDAAKALEDRFTAAMSDMSFLMSADVGEALMDHRVKMGDLRTAYDDTRTAMENLIEQYGPFESMPERAKEQYGGLQESLQGLSGEIQNEADAWQRSTNEILFNLATRALASLPVEDQALAMAALATELDLIDPATASAWEAIGEITAQLANGTITAEQYADDISAVGDELNSIPSTTQAEVDVTVTAHGDLYVLSYVGRSGTVRGTYTGPQEDGGGGGGGSSTPRTSPVIKPGMTREARGGFARVGEGWILVGDPGPNSELITPEGVIIPAAQTRDLLRSGLLPESHAAIGMDLSAGGSGGGTSLSTIYGTTKPSSLYSKSSSTSKGGVKVSGGTLADWGLPTMDTSSSTVAAAAAAASAAEAASSAAETVAAETSYAVSSAIGAIGAEIGSQQQSNQENIQAVMRQQESLNTRMLRTLEDIRSVLQQQGTALDIGSAVSEGIQWLDI